MMIISTKVLIMVSTAAATITASFLSMGLDIKPSPFDTARAAESDKEQLMASYHKPPPRACQLFFYAFFLRARISPAAPL